MNELHFEDLPKECDEKNLDDDLLSNNSENETGSTQLSHNKHHDLSSPTDKLIGSLIGHQS